MADAITAPHHFAVRTAHPAALSRDIRQATDEFTAQRRRIVALSLTSAACMGLIALYQIGSIKHLPEPPLPLTDADKVDASEEAYARFSVGDAFLGFASYSVTMLLAGIGGPERHETSRWVPVALAAKVGFDAAQAAKLSVDQWTKHRAFCTWCLVAAGATFAAVPAVWPELRATLRRKT